MPLAHFKETLLYVNHYGLSYQGMDQPLFQDLNFTLRQGERVFLAGANGCGKSSLFRAILQKNGMEKTQENLTEDGTLQMASGLTISYINQDTSFLKGGIKDFCRKRNLDESLFCSILRQLDMERVQFGKNMEDFSEGQKKKVLIAASLLTPAHLYLWDEPLNYIDIFSRMQIEKLLTEYHPTMLIVEHDVRFREKIGTKTVEI